MVVFSPFVLLLCTFWELCARFLMYIMLFTDQKKKRKGSQHLLVAGIFFMKLYMLLIILVQFAYQKIKNKK